ncbi:sulfate transporter CysZ [Catenovulum maritimum]|uniref:Cysteine biosynthesis protein CysZ n=1 Tax=Catenovulum maritimum TaxID=1513271 RepID=A0A0J8GU75_9ALTE|nr:sulfate transporter CysZ [Catenovulum maritimum]KMT64238.1 cysteine biosynthesis protein CysZ [Catenovulum maritimum]
MGIEYLFRGFGLLNQKGIRKYVYLPILLNVILLSVSFYWLYQELSGLKAFLEGFFPSYLSWLADILFPLSLIGVMFFFSLVFTSINNFIAAPFNGLLASKIEQMHLSEAEQAKIPQFKLSEEVGRALTREWQKMVYYIPRALFFFVLFMTIPIVGQLLWLGFIAWMMAVQYCDYSYDNNGISFIEMKNELWRHKADCFSFGFIVSFLTMLPIINLIIAPAAVCGSSLLWVEKHRQSYF